MECNMAFPSHCIMLLKRYRGFDGMFASWMYYGSAVLLPHLKMHSPAYRRPYTRPTIEFWQTSTRTISRILSTCYNGSLSRSARYSWTGLSKCLLRIPIQKVDDPCRRLRDPQNILTICFGLITSTVVVSKSQHSGNNNAVDQDRAHFAQVRELRLAHFSVREYLVSERLRRSDNPLSYYHFTRNIADTSIAKTCRPTYCHSISMVASTQAELGPIH